MRDIITHAVITHDYSLGKKPTTMAHATAKIMVVANIGLEEMTKSEYKEKAGGFRASAFIFVMVALENMGFIANMGLALVTIQAYSKDLHPPYCGKSSCIKGNIAVMFYASLSLIALGAGGVKGALPALGGDQFDQKDPKEAKALARFFNWLLLSTILGACVGVTGIVYVSTEKHYWYWGFFISTVAAFIGFLVLAFGKPFYRLRQPTPADSPIIRIAQVIVAAIKNRRLALPENPDELYHINEKEKGFREEIISHTNQFSWLDKAAIVPKDSKPTPWSVCTVTQVEEVKILTRMLPILGSTIIMNTCMAQLQTFSVEQGSAMNRQLGNFKVPAASIPIIPLLFMSVLIPVYEFVFVPFARKITQHPSGIRQLQRVGVGLVLSAISMAVAGVIEVKRRNQAHKDITKPLSLFWLSFQYGIFGIADMFTLVGLLEFFYKEAPVCMRSLSTSFTWLSLSLGYFLSTVLVNIINSVTKRITPSKLGWLHGLDLNQNNLNLFYWFLAILSCLNFLNYLYWASWYKYKTEEPRLDAKPILAKEESAVKESSTVLAAKEESAVHVDGINGGASETNYEAPSSFDQTSTGPLLANAKEESDAVGIGGGGASSETNEASVSVLDQKEDAKAKH
ncbi:Proton-dependent oligopeptide transporter family [Corchorus capsularis]|uniref:Proton-dependent oligopeptide transporter family n=1 Tax=Corchorus capsularis TaxID=210143 RepID=A0A1R3IUE0_COCAP|nr:Proton-dependent oligopeptide transporter family [Corchorus capsularis]